MTTLLIVEDDAKIRAQLTFQLRDEGFAPAAVGSAEEAMTWLEGQVPDLLLLDVRLPGISGVELVRRLSEAGHLPPTVIVSGEASVSEALEVLRLGVGDFIEKPFSKERLLQSIRTTLERADLRRQVADLRSQLGGELLGDSPAMQQLRALVARAAPTDARVLIQGESGTGKELVANALHQQSRRRDGPFIKINCAAIPDHLIEDELFGHVKGAFTDARSARPGLFEEADGGTLFLDEIGDMDYPLQSRLLRVLEDGRVRRVGDSRDRQVDVRVLAASHHDLEAAVAAGRFRQDLFFRLAHLPIPVPPLRRREGDVPRLVRHFVDAFCRQHRLRPRRIDDDVWPHLERYRWPGNVRELRNLCERLVVFGTDPLTAEQLPSALLEEAGDQPVTRETGLLRLPEGRPTLTLRELRNLCEREYIEQVLQHCGWNVAAAARRLDIQRTYMHQKMTALGLRRPATDGAWPED